MRRWDQIKNKRQRWREESVRKKKKARAKNKYGTERREKGEVGDERVQVKTQKDSAEEGRGARKDG